MKNALLVLTSIGTGFLIGASDARADGPPAPAPAPVVCPPCPCAITPQQQKAIDEARAALDAARQGPPPATVKE